MALSSVSSANLAHRLLRLPSVVAETGFSRSTIYQRISQGLWPEPVRLSAASVAWPAREIDALNAALIAGSSEAEIRDLVTRLMKARKTLRPSSV